MPISSLPFRCIFDILFLHEGADHLASLFGQDDLHIALKALLRDPRSVELLLTCCVVRRLDHPAHALLLLEPVEATFPDSVRAWSMSRRALPRHALVLAMKAFLPKRGDVYEWLDVDDLWRERSPAEWQLLARQTLSNHRFTAEWRCECRSAPDETMGMAIWRKADEEVGKLLGALEREEQDRLMAFKLERRGQRVKGFQAPIRITPNEVQRIREDAELRRASHLKVVAEVERAFATMSADMFDRRFGRIVHIIASLARERPLIRWSLKRCLHLAAWEHDDRPVWPTEHAIETSDASVDEPMDALRAMLRADVYSH